MSKADSPALISRVALWLFLILAGVLAGYWFLTRPLLGDDAYYTFDLLQRGSIFRLPGHAAAVWCGCNGRFGEMIFPIWTAWLPRWFSALVAFVSIPILQFSILRLAGLRRSMVLACAVAVGLTAWTFPWWDMSHLVCFTNYPWALALVFVALIPLLEFRLESRLWLLAAPVVFLGGAYHEASGLPLVAGLVVWALFCGGWKRLSTVGKVWFSIIVFGGLMTLSSPAIWNRMADHDVSASPLMLISTSAYLVYLLIAVTVAVMCVNRALIKKLLKDTWVIFAVAAISSAVIVAAGGTLGRPGMFTQAFSIIALGRMYVVGGASSLSPKAESLVAVAIYVLAACSAVFDFKKEMVNTDKLQRAYDIFHEDPTAARNLVIEVFPGEPWEPASLKTLDSRYDRLKDRNYDFSLAADSLESKKIVK